MDWRAGAPVKLARLLLWAAILSLLVHGSATAAAVDGRHADQAVPSSCPGAGAGERECVQMIAMDHACCSTALCGFFALVSSAQATGTATEGILPSFATPNLSGRQPSPIERPPIDDLRAS